MIIYSTLNTATSYQGDGVSGVYLYGFQIEEGSYPTSYIPTSGSAVTRVNDFSTKTSASNLIGQTEGTLFLDINLTAWDTSSFYYGLYGSGNEIYFRCGAVGALTFLHYYGGTQASLFKTGLSLGRHKLAACYKNNDWVFYLDGVLVGSDTSGTFSGTINSISFGYTVGAYQPFESVNQALLFKTRLSNTELAALTTL